MRIKYFITVILVGFLVNQQASAQETDERSMRFSGLEYKSKDSLFYINFRFRMQSRLGFTTKDADDFEINEWDARVRRLRLRGDGYILGEKLAYSFQLSFSRGDQDFDNTGVANIVRDAVVFYHFNKNFYVAFGQNKLPGNRQRVNSSGQLQFAERSIVNAALTVDRDFGLKAYYTNKIGESVYHLKGAISTGEGRSVNSTDKGLAYTGRVEFLPLGSFTKGGDYSEGDLEREQSVKVSLAGGYSFNKGTTNTGGQLGTDLYNGVDMGTLMLDAIVKYNGWAYAVEYLKRDVNNPFTYNDANELSYAFEGTGMNHQASYIFKNNLETAFRYSHLKPSSALSNIEKTREVFELGLSKYLRGHRVKAQININYNVNNEQYTLKNQGNYWGTMFQVELGI